MNTKIKWGILGTGHIAQAFVSGLKYVPESEIIAVGSRSMETAVKFGNEYNIPKRYSSYEELVKDPDIQVIYISTPHPFHAENSILCLENGKSVLCEKPFTVNFNEADKVIRKAKETNLFVMEAMWTRFLPAYAKVRELLNEKVIGDIKMVTADFGFSAPWNPKSRIFNPDLAGGGLLDVGIYPISFASMIFGKPPKEISSLAHIGTTGVDEQAGIIFNYDCGGMAVIHCGARLETPKVANVIGTKGYIELGCPFFKAQKITLCIEGNKEEIDLSYEGNGLYFQAKEVNRCLLDGITESPFMPHEDTLYIMSTLDKIRKIWGLKYPKE